MPKLELVTVYCERQQDITGEDELRIRVNNAVVWSGAIDKAESKNLGPKYVNFNQTADVEVDEMNGNKAKQIGDAVTIRSAKTATQQATFKTSGAHYELTYRVS
ncbi:hypothetical protein [Cryptosporangium minutisporangium]